MRPRYLSIAIVLAVIGCDSSNPVAATSVGSDEVDTSPPPPASPPGPSVARPAFKVMTYNVQLANFGAPNTASRKPMIVEIIRSEAPDIVGIQELGSSHRVDIEAGLQDLYDIYDGGSGTTAELILLRKNVLVGSGQGVVTLSTRCGGALGVTFLEVRSLRGVSFVLANTHLCFTDPAQHAVGVIDTLAARFSGRHIVLLGDLNSREGGDTMNFLLQQGELLGRVSPVQFFDTWTLAGGNRASRVGTGIDWVLTTDGTGQFIGVQDATVVANASQASDHTPITATLF